MTEQKKCIKCGGDILRYGKKYCSISCSNLKRYYSQSTKDKIRHYHLGLKPSADTREKMSFSQKSRVRTPFSVEARKRMSLAQKGKKLSKDHIQKITLKNKGKKRSEAFCEHNAIIKRGIKLPSLSGEKHWNWKGGINPKNDTIRKSLENKIWINEVLKRDNFTCQKSGIKGGKLTVHHIYNFSDHPNLRFKIKNGITFSKKEHLNFHKRYGIKNNTETQLLDFIKTKDNE